jgi:AcrR family transcriptional regulator
LYYKTILVDVYYSKLSKEEQLREDVIQSAQQSFQQFGLHKTTMEDMAKAMGRGKSTLYYFPKARMTSLRL